MTKSRRKFTDEFKREAVELMAKEGLSVVEAGRRLGVHANVLRNWKRLAEQGLTKPAPKQSTALEVENRQLRDEVRRLTMEREILKKAAAFFAKESR